VQVGLFVVGRPRDAALAEAIAEYETRAARYWPLTVTEVREAGSRAADAAGAKRLEADRLLERLLSRAEVVACDPGGEQLDSTAFAAWLRDRRDRAQDVAFVIGGAYGLGDAVRERARKRLALAPWTLPHELARLVLAEQLYRAGTIGRGEPYHK